MAKLIKHVSELPKWFSLEKYETAKSLDAAGWYEQLSARRDMITLIGSPRWNGWNPNDLPKTATYLIKVLELVRAMPILNIADNTILAAYFFGGAMRELKSKDLRYSFGVHLTTVRNLYLTENNIEEDKRAHARGFFEQVFSDDFLDFEKPLTKLKYKCEDWIDEPVDGIVKNINFNLNVTVNMLLPDKVLIEQFKQLLQQNRNQLTRVGCVIENTEKPNFSAWCEHGVLPYLDLQMWQRETGMKIPNRVMADAIFPPGEGGEEKIRKTTKELAVNLLTRNHLETLAALAAQEIAEQNKS